MAPHRRNPSPTQLKLVGLEESAPTDRPDAIPEWEPLELPDRVAEDQSGLELLQELHVRLLQRSMGTTSAILAVAEGEVGQRLEDLGRFNGIVSANIHLLRSGRIQAHEAPDVLEMLRQVEESMRVWRRATVQALPPDTRDRLLEAEQRLAISPHAVLDKVDRLAEDFLRSMEVEREVEDSRRRILARWRDELEQRPLPARQGLKSLLKGLPVDWLDAIAEIYGVAHLPRRAERERALGVKLCRLEILEAAVWQGLGDAERRALKYVLERGGAIPRSIFTRRFGKDEDAESLWGLGSSASVLGALRVLGLAFVGRGELGGREQRLVVIPRELRGGLAEALRHSPESDSSGGEDESPESAEVRAQALADQWLGEIAETEAWARLGPKAQNRLAAVVGMVARHMAACHDQSPDEWTPEALAECLLETVPCKVSADADFFAAIPGDLGLFLGHLQRRGHPARAGELLETLREISDEVPRAAMDTSRWGPAKAFTMAARSAGVDTSDKKAMERFVAEYNRRLDEQPMPPMTVRVGKKVGRNDPCPCGSGKKYKRCCGAPRSS